MHIENALWFEEGLKEAMQSGEVKNWLINFFKTNEENLCFNEAVAIVIYDEDINNGNSYFRSIHFTGNDDHQMLFIIENLQCDDLYRFKVTSSTDYSDCEKVFFTAFEKFNEILKEKSSYKIC